MTSQSTNVETQDQESSSRIPNRQVANSSNSVTLVGYTLADDTADNPAVWIIIVKKIHSDSDHTFVDLFAGCGGFSLGMISAGWSGVFAVEKSPDAFATLRHNLVDGHELSGNMRFDWPTGVLDIGPHDIREIANLPTLAELRGKVALVIGGPPCQGFSFLGKRSNKDPRNELFKEYLKVVDALKPTFVLMENVRGIDVPFRSRNETNSRPKSYAARIKAALVNHGYAVEQGIIRATDFGVPQYRPRYFTFGIRSELLNSADETARFFERLSDHRVAFLARKGLGATPITVSQAISDLRTSNGRLVDNSEPGVPSGFKRVDYQRPKTKYQELMHRDAEHRPMNGTMDSMRLANHRSKTVERFREIQLICEGGVQLSRTARLGITHPTRKSSLTLLSGEKPSHTITTLPDDLIHYSEPRIHTVREYARLQSFPDWFQFRGKYTTGGERRAVECPRYTQVGNAVPPLVAEAIGECLIEMLVEFSGE